MLLEILNHLSGNRMKQYSLIDSDDLKTMTIAPGCSLRRPNGEQIQPSQVLAYSMQGEVIELYKGNKNVGRIRPPNQNTDCMGEMIERGRHDNFKSAVNWIDFERKRFWCPVCAKNQSKPGMVSAWVQEGREICLYAICKRCVTQGMRLQELGDMAGMQRLVDLAERQLAGRYPHIASNLSANYFGQ